MKITIEIPAEVMEDARIHRVERKLYDFLDWLENDLPENVSCKYTISKP